MNNLTTGYVNDLAQIGSNGIPISESPFGKIDYIGTLLFEEYPTTSIYKDDDSNPVIREWVDCSNDGKVDRYFYFQTTRFDLLQFVTGKVTYRDFVFTANNNSYHFIDFHEEEIISSTLIFKKGFPNIYYPSAEYRFKDDDGVDLENIKEYFGLEQLIESKIDSKVLELANRSNTETFNIHLEEGNGIGFGVANTELLGNSLLRFNSLYEEATLDYFLGADRDSAYTSHKKQFQHYTSTEVYANIAASYSLLIRPIHAQYDLFDDNKSSSEIVAGKIFKLFENAKDIDLLAESFSNYSPNLIESFKSFLKTIHSSRVKLGFNWYNPHSEIIFVEKVDFKVSHTLLSNIESLTTTSSEVIKARGLFEIVHCNTSYFGFVSLDNNYYTGYLDAKIRESIRKINFVDEYEVVIVQKTYEVSGRSEPKIENRIISYYKVPDNERVSKEIDLNG